MNLKEIAKVANVSPSTVSFVLNNTGQVSEETRKKVSALLTENGYTVSPYYRNKIIKKFRFIKFSNHAMLVQENTGFISEIIDAIRKEIKRLGYSLEITAANKDNIAQIAEAAATDDSDGILLLGTELEEEIKYFKDTQKPVVVVDNPMTMRNCNTVATNSNESIRTAVEYLVSLGHREIGYLYSNTPSGNCRARFKAFKHIMTDMKLELPPRNIFTAMPTLTQAYNDIANMLQKGVSFPKAILATNDIMAIGAMKAFHEFGLSVPEDISMIGFDDIAFSTIVEPALTTIRVPCTDIGVWAVRLLSDKVNYPDSAPVKIEVSTELVVRESTCRT